MATTEQRIEKVKEILTGMQKNRNTSYNEHGYIGVAETDAEKALVQLLNICVNQEAELSILKQQMAGITGTMNKSIEDGK